MTIICIHVVFFCTRLNISWITSSESTATPPHSQKKRSHGNHPGATATFFCRGNHRAKTVRRGIRTANRLKMARDRGTQPSDVLIYGTPRLKTVESLDWLVVEPPISKIWVKMSSSLPQIFGVKMSFIFEITTNMITSLLWLDEDTIDDFRDDIFWYLMWLQHYIALHQSIPPGNLR